VVHHLADTSDLAVHLSSAEWSTVQRVQAIWWFTFPPAALYKQTGWCRVTTTFIAIALLCCSKNLTIAEAFSLCSQASTSSFRVNFVRRVSFVKSAKTTINFVKTAKNPSNG
jgi:hypothetical protein